MTDQTAAAARRLGERAGRTFLETGVMPRCPFGDDPAAEWARALLAVIGPALKPKEKP